VAGVSLLALGKLASQLTPNAGEFATAAFGRARVRSAPLTNAQVGSCRLESRDRVSRPPCAHWLRRHGCAYANSSTTGCFTNQRHWCRATTAWRPPEKGRVRRAPEGLRGIGAIDLSRRGAVLLALDHKQFPVCHLCETASVQRGNADTDVLRARNALQGSGAGSAAACGCFWAIASVAFRRHRWRRPSQPCLCTGGASTGRPALLDPSHCRSAEGRDSIPKSRSPDRPARPVRDARKWANAIVNRGADPGRPGRAACRPYGGAVVKGQR
jgi:hypothetical protein